MRSPSVSYHLVNEVPPVVLFGYSPAREGLHQGHRPINAHTITEPLKDKLLHKLARLSPISLAEMDEVALLRRIDSKYLCRLADLPKLIAELADDYQILEIGNKRLQRYQSLYFDTADFGFYQAHRAGHLNRYKLRSRSYLDSGTHFLEVKYKTNQERTLKYRLATSEFVDNFHSSEPNFQSYHDFLKPLIPYEVSSLQPSLMNHFKRLTLASLKHKERITIDLDLGFSASREATLSHMTMSELVVIELKREAFKAHSAFERLLKSHKIYPSGFSKYAVGLSFLYPLKSNRFKPIHRQLNKLTAFSS
ncbi:MAG: polyphosphate polymerase domain-containing protein [Deinococcales bacterium]